MAKWLERGTEHLQNARMDLQEFLQNFPDHPRADDAEERLHEVVSMQAARDKKVARFYLKHSGQPTSAVPYLRFMTEAYPDSRESDWARKKLEQLRERENAPLRGKDPEMQVTGVSRQAGE
jgi:outer membrane protein assembly factor BamD (BamD/ComL family)